MHTPATATTRPPGGPRSARRCDRWWGRDEHGSAVVEAAIGVPAFGLFVALIILAGRMSMAHQAVESAANDAARAASIARTQAAAQTGATSSARTSLVNQKVNCRAISVSLDTGALAKPAGTPGMVTATVTCRVNLADLSLPGVPGAKTVTATVSSPIDTYRQGPGGFTTSVAPTVSGEQVQR